jgi:Ca-activated chloride channel family protein
MFGSLLRSSPFVKNIGWNDIVALAEISSGKDDLLQKEFLKLVQQAKTLYTKVKKKKGSGSGDW